MAYVRLQWLAAACHECATHKQASFDIYRVRSKFDWIPARKRFAFSRED